MKLLFIGHTRIGDAILSTGLLGHLAGQGYDDITVVCGAPAAPLFGEAPGVSRVIVLNKQRFALHWLGLWRELVATRWDMIVDLRNSAMVRTLWARKRAVVPRSRADEHRVVRMARTLKLEQAIPAPRLWPTQTQQQKAAELVPEGTWVLGVGPTANWRGKIWQADRFAALAKTLTGPGGILEGGRVAVFGAQNERAAAAPMLAALADDRVIDLIGAADLPTVGACLGRCALFVGNDSGLMHMAAAAGTPTLGLFGPSRAEQYAPWGSRTAFVRTDLAYEALVGGPGYDHRRTESLMDSLAVEKVEEAAVALWGKTA